ncbi:MAG: alpha/beta hydrolase [Rhodospirillales bacterium]|nr:alpha/beta hydrolase [Rhodospirillales bacterium]
MDTLMNAPATSHSTPSVEPGSQAFLDALAKAGGPPIYTLTPAAARDVLAGAQAGPVAKPEADIQDLTIPAGPLGAVDLRIIRPKGSTARLPAILYLHGGGWVLGDRNTHDRLVREIAVGVQAAVVFVDYHRSPEAQFPVPGEEGYAALQYLAAHADAFNIDADRIAIAGDSVGGALAAAVTLMAKQRGGPTLVQQVLFYPVANADFDTGSYRQFAEGPWLTRKAMQWFWDQYLPDHGKRNAPEAAPLKATLAQLKGLPPALVITDENDVLRDEGEAYAAKLAAAGVPVVQVRYLGAIHDFVMLNGLAETEPTRGAIAQAIDTLKRALNR